MEEKIKKHKIPETDSIEELAHFWNTHDLTDFEEELEEVTEPVFVRQTETLSIQLLPQEVATILQMAKSRGASSTELVQGWIREKIQVSNS